MSSPTDTLEKQVCPTCLRPKRYVADVLDELKDEVVETLRDLDTTVGTNTEALRSAAGMQGTHATTLQRLVVLLDKLIEEEHTRVETAREHAKAAADVARETAVIARETAKVDADALREATRIVAADRQDRRKHWREVILPIAVPIVTFLSGIGGTAWWFGGTPPAAKPEAPITVAPPNED